MTGILTVLLGASDANGRAICECDRKLIAALNNLTGSDLKTNYNINACLQGRFLTFKGSLLVGKSIMNDLQSSRTKSKNLKRSSFAHRLLQL